MSDPSSSASAGLLTPGSRAIAGLALAVAALMGQNVLSTGLQILIAGPSSGDPRVFTLALGLAAAVPAVLSLLLVGPQVRDRSSPGWVAALSGAAVLVAAVALVGAVLTVAGGLLHGGY